MGRRDIWDRAHHIYRQEDGWLQPLIRRGMATEINHIEPRSRSELTILPKAGKAYRPWPGGHGDKALIAKLQAVAGEYDMLLFMVDADSNVPADFAKILAEIRNGFARIEGDIRCIACVPMAASESWMMADPAAWLAVSGQQIDELPPKPEEVWGHRDDPDGNRPHRLFARICDRAELPDNPDTRRRIAEQIDLDVLSASCPVSAAPFLAELAVA
jgi:hypothetical protein